MAFSGVGKFLSDLTAQTAATDTDLVPIGAPGTLKKITFANLRKALGVDTINTSIGTLTSLSTTTKTSLVDAINEIFTSVDTLNSKIGIKTLYYEVSASGPAYANKSLYDNTVALRAAYAPNEPVIIYLYSGALSDAYNQSLPVAGVPNIVTVKCPPDPARAAITFEGIGADTVRYCKIMGGTISNWHA